MNNLAIVHFLPVELFPPIINLLDVVKNWNASITHLYTIQNHKNSKTVYFENVVVKRYSSPAEKGIGKIKSILRHFTFTFRVFVQLIKQRPAKILYYESFSALPVFLYSFFINRQVSIFIHCHEYYSPSWYRLQSTQLRLNYLIEKWYLYEKAEWISQTNEARKKLFIDDNRNINSKKIMVIPNYPPKRWKAGKNSIKNSISNKIRFVYIGTLSIKYTYIKEFCEWVKNIDNAQFDIFGFNYDHDALQYLESLDIQNINFHKNGIDYDEIPKILAEYNIGVILYKAITLNFKYNATNKLFEYLTCGLDVWFPQEMLGCYEYITSDTYPQVKKLDFNQPHNINLGEMKRGSLSYKSQHFNCENALQPLVEKLLD